MDPRRKSVGSSCSLCSSLPTLLRRDMRLHALVAIVSDRVPDTRFPRPRQSMPSFRLPVQLNIIARDGALCLLSAKLKKKLIN